MFCLFALFTFLLVCLFVWMFGEVVVWWLQWFCYYYYYYYYYCCCCCYRIQAHFDKWPVASRSWFGYAKDGGGWIPSNRTKSPYESQGNVLWLPSQQKSFFHECISKRICRNYNPWNRGLVSCCDNVLQTVSNTLLSKLYTQLYVLHSLLHKLFLYFRLLIKTPTLCWTCAKRILRKDRSLVMHWR